MHSRLENKQNYIGLLKGAEISMSGQAHTPHGLYTLTKVSSV